MTAPECFAGPPGFPRHGQHDKPLHVTMIGAPDMECQGGEQAEQGWAEVAGHNIPDMNHPKVTVADVTFDHGIRVGQSAKRDAIARILAEHRWVGGTSFEAYTVTCLCDPHGKVYGPLADHQAHVADVLAAEVAR